MCVCGACAMCTCRSARETKEYSCCQLVLLYRISSLSALRVWVHEHLRFSARPPSAWRVYCISRADGGSHMCGLCVCASCVCAQCTIDARLDYGNVCTSWSSRALWRCTGTIVALQSRLRSINSLAVLAVVVCWCVHDAQFGTPCCANFNIETQRIYTCE